MIQVTAKSLEEIMKESFKKKVTYVGRASDMTYRRTVPIKFAFIEWDEEKKFKSLVFIQEKHILQLIKEKNEQSTIYDSRGRRRNKRGYVSDKQPSLLAGL